MENTEDRLSLEEEKNLIRKSMKTITIFVIINVIALIFSVEFLNAVITFGLAAINFVIAIIGMCAISEGKIRKDSKKAKKYIEFYLLGKFAMTLFMFYIAVLPMGMRCMCGHMFVVDSARKLFYIFFTFTMLYNLIFVTFGKNKLESTKKIILLSVILSTVSFIVVFSYNSTFPDPHILN